MKKHFYYTYVIPLSVLILVFSVSLTPIFSKIEGSIYNFVLGLKKSIAEHPDILLIDFGDEAINIAGTYPVSRDIYGDGLFLLKEFNSSYVIFDIEFLDPSPRGVDYKVLNKDIPRFIDNKFSIIKNNTELLFKSISEGSISLKDGILFIDDLNSITEETKNEVNSKIQKIVRDNDKYIGQSSRIFKNSYFTININPAKIIDEDNFNYFKRNFSYKIDVQKKPNYITYTGAIPTIFHISQYIKGAGFTNVVIDDDGVRRRIDLFREIDDTFFLQLSMSPLMDWFGNPDMELRGRKLILKNINFPQDESLQQLEIPLNPDGSFNINWLPKKYINSFKHLPYQKLIVHDQLYNKLVNNIVDRSDWGYLNLYRKSPSFVEMINYLEDERELLYNSRDPDISSYRETRDFLISELIEFLTPENSNTILESLENLYQNNYLDEQSYRIIKEDVPKWFEYTKTILDDLVLIRNDLRNVVPNSFAIIGNTATGTTDIGVNPFEKEYMNVGTHASVANTILNREFITLAPKWLIVFISLIFSVLLTFIIRHLKPLRSILAGTLSVILINVLLILYFRFTLNYIELLFPSSSILLTFIILTAFNFVSSEKDKRYINNAFSHYLSVDVIHEILDDPSKLKLGGEQKYLTAMFTDVQSFSTFSEKLTPEELVRLLNAYLTEMSDIIMAHKGTIDKYEGDAIISFFGAPIYFENHAYQSCISAIAMKRIETTLNKRFQEDHWTEDLILTRIGINSGEMVVGNMGTDKKMDYTMMGNAVNLASRLEGVNKQYGTWILVSEETRKACPDTLCFRRLDRVRVVGIHTPVRLYELVEEVEQLDDDHKAAYEAFDKALTLFEDRNWKEAKKLFRESNSLLKGDKPSLLYISRCDEYLREEPRQEWDGVYNLDEK